VGEPDDIDRLDTDKLDTDKLDTDKLDDVVSPLMVEAGHIAMRWFRAPVPVENKGGSAGFDPVTEADRVIESFLRGELTRLFPDTEIVGEEAGATGPAGRVTWMIDPIDGTKAYLTGLPLWGILLGLMVDGRPVAGWCRQPYLDESFGAAGKSGWMSHAGARRPLATSDTTDLTAAAMYSTHPGMFALPWEQAAFERLAGHARVQRFGGDCYLYCLLASGHIDLVVEANLQPYDIVPLIPIVQAAGGVVTGPDGEVPTSGGFVIAAATRELHDQVMDIVTAARSRSSPGEHVQ
jgi:histidinol phosphatase-like enzyme (inositol monophosphatase family)